MSVREKMERTGPKRLLALDGGGIRGLEGTVTLIDSTICANTADGDGGGIYSEAVLNVTNSTIGGTGLGNESAQNGGGVSLNSGSDHSLTNVTFSSNTATSGWGGGLNLCVQDTAQIANVVFDGNSAVGGGGISAASTSSRRWTRSPGVCATFSSDTARAVLPVITAPTPTRTPPPTPSRGLPSPAWRASKP